MKKILAIVLCLIMVMLSSCQVDVKDFGNKANGGRDGEPESSIENTVSTTTTKTTPNPDDAMYAQLAKLTKEDGTGEISLDMDVDEIVAVFDKYGIPYQDYSPGSKCVSAGGNRYTTKLVAGYGMFSLQQSYKGLKVGDTVEKVLELYGEPDEIHPNYNDYQYFQKTITDGTEDSRIVFSVRIENDIVTLIVIEAEDPTYFLGGENY